MDLAFDDNGKIEGTIFLPGGITGILKWQGSEISLSTGENVM